MNVDYMNINDFIESKKDDVFIKNFKYSIAAGLLLVLCIILMLLIKIKDNYKGQIYINKDEVYTIVDSDYVKDFLNNDELLIDDKLIKYEIFAIINYGDMSKISFNIDLKNTYIEDNLINYQLLISEENIITYLCETIK